jgi:hypothetical protein
MTTHEYNIQELWDVTKRPNLRIHVVEEGAEIQMKSIEDLFNEIIAIYVIIQTPMYRRHFKLQIDMTRKEQPHIIL